MTEDFLKDMIKLTVRVPKVAENLIKREEQEELPKIKTEIY
jgi:hypothetical protein